MTKRHFKMFADAIHTLAASPGYRAREEAWATAHIVMSVAERVNPRFNKERFLQACGFSDPGDHTCGGPDVGPDVPGGGAP